MLNLLLTKKGIPCEMAEDGVECLEKVEKHSLDYFNIIFMDNMMPKMNGEEATRVLRLRGYQVTILIY